jgi:hypothetical protein
LPQASEKARRILASAKETDSFEIAKEHVTPTSMIKKTLHFDLESKKDNETVIEKTETKRKHTNKTKKSEKKRQNKRQKNKENKIEKQNAKKKSKKTSQNTTSHSSPTVKFFFFFL